VAEKRNRAKELIEDFMIAANGAIARFLEEHRFPVLRRVVHSPERLQRIVEIAQAHGEKLPPAPDAKALNDFFFEATVGGPASPTFRRRSSSCSPVGELFVEYQLSAQRQRLDLCVAIAAHGYYAPGYIGTQIACSQGASETGPNLSLVAPSVMAVLMDAIKPLLMD